MNETSLQNLYIEKMKGWLKKQEKQKGRPLCASCVTFGCQMNEKDSEKLLGILEEIGFVPVDGEKADLLIFNTCTVRENANTKLYGHLGHVKKQKEKNPHMLVALCGCMMQEEHVVDTIEKKYPFVDLIFGTHNIFKLAQLLYERIDTGERVVDIWKDTDQIVENLPSDRKYSFKCGVNIMYGCNNFCSYCIVPYVRGRERSRRPEDILDEIKALAEDGVVEVMLLGQNVNSYGKTFSNPMSFAQLLREVEKIDGIKRIRFMTSHPKDLSDELIQVMAESSRICRHLHLPVQSGSTRILSKMNRHYTSEEYLNLIGKIRTAIPDMVFTTDLIVGFPGETQEDFQETIRVVKEAKFASAYTYIYSKRTGTPAAAMGDQVDEETVKERFPRLLQAIKETAPLGKPDLMGKTMEVLVEGVNDHQEGFVTGRLSNNILVHFPGDQSMIGTFTKVTLTEDQGFYYMGERDNG